MLLNRDFEDLIHCLNVAEAKYVVVGAYAVIIYTEPRYTKDIDFLIETTPENAKKVYDALKDFGAPLHDVTVEDFCKPDMVYQIGIEPNRIDIIMGIKGLSFDDLWGKKQPFQYGKENTFVIDLENLIRSKQIAGRPEDEKDISKLLKAAMLKKK